VKPDLTTLEAAVLTAETAHQRQLEAVNRLGAQIDPVRARVAAHAEAKQAWDAWRLESVALTREPAVPEAKPAPIAPARPRPTEEAVAAARVLLEGERAAAAVRTERAAARRAAEGRLVAATDTLAARRGTLARLEALLVAVRKAPGALLDAQITALGDLGNLRFRALSGKGACIEAVVVGEHGAQAWDNASDGEKVLADASFRDAMRRKLKTTALPLIIDRTNLYAPKDGAAWPRFSGPRWLLVSTRTASGGIEVGGAS
jgi:hypothetical protein